MLHANKDELKDYLARKLSQDNMQEDLSCFPASEVDCEKYVRMYRGSLGSCGERGRGKREPACTWVSLHEFAAVGVRKNGFPCLC